ncbi:MAG: DJ-1/PfpI family protein [Candidatus Cloacimonetes bacterium]|nr:DJ-1/PfpI family protein [Candidatus Cloacimonadota bacterium]
MKTGKVLLIIMCFLISLQHLVASDVEVLLIVPNWFGANSYYLMEMFSEFGWQVTYTAVNPTVNPCFWGQPIAVDIVIAQLGDIEEFDVIAICPSRWYNNPPNAYNDLLNSQETLDLLVNANNAGKIIYATCAGVRVLAAAGILEGVNITGNPYYESEYIAAGANYLGDNIPPVIDGNIVTSTRGEYYWIQNAEAIMTALQQQNPLSR